jgi:hypothetical protein
MTKTSGFGLSAVFVAAAFAAAVTPTAAQVQNFKPVTDEMLRNPSPNDWLMYSRTYDAFRDSPLKQINKNNVKNLRMAWVRGLEDGDLRVCVAVGEGARRASCDAAGIQSLHNRSRCFSRRIEERQFSCRRSNLVAHRLNGHLNLKLRAGRCVSPADAG